MAIDGGLAWEGKLLTIGLAAGGGAGLWEAPVAAGVKHVP